VVSLFKELMKMKYLDSLGANLGGDLFLRSYL
jgi:hypothetical protein